MKNVVKYRVHQVYVFLREATPVMVFVAIIFFGSAIIGLQQDNKRLLEDTRATVKNTEVIVEKQDEILDAIRQLSLDNKLTSKQLGDTIICMLLVPVNQRTTNTQEVCREQAVSQTPASDESGSTPSQPVPQTAPQPTGGSSSPEPTPAPQQTMNPLQSLWQVITQPVDDILNLL